jgi:hypothetical protein
MLRIAIAVFGLVATGSASAVQLSCSEDDNTHQRLCYNPKDVRSNGNLRAVRLFKGGPQGVNETTFMAVIDCKIGYLELRDKQGVAFARDQPEKLYAVQFRDFVCEEAKPKVDKSLR